MTPEAIRAVILARLAESPATTASLGYRLQVANGYDKAYRQVMRLKADGKIVADGKEHGAVVWRLA